MNLVDTATPFAGAEAVNANFAEVATAIADLDVRVTNLGNPVNGGGELVNVMDYGATPASLDNTSAIQAAQAVARQRGAELFFPGGEFYGLVEVQHNDMITGASRYRSTIKAPAGSNSNVITGKDAAALIATPPPTNSLDAGANRVIIQDIALDGNTANNTAGCGLMIWGCAMTLMEVDIRNCSHDGMHTAWNTGWMPMEGTFSNISIDNVGYHGWRFDGPHDSQVENLVIVDASQSIDNGFMGVLIGLNTWMATARFYNLHVWHKSTSTNRCFAAVQSNGGCEFIASHFEGCRTNQLRHMGQNDRVVASKIYAPFSADGTALVVFNGNLNHHIGNEYHSGNGTETNEKVFALQIGEANTAASNLVAEGMFLGFSTKTPFNFVNSVGGNRITGRGYAASGGATAFSGTIQSTDEIDYCQTGTAINYRKPQALPVYASNTAAATAGVPVGGHFILSTTNAVTVRT